MGGDLNYVMTPAGLVAPEELEPGVGLIEVDDCGVAVVTRKPRRMGNRDPREFPQDEVLAILQRLSNMWRFPNGYWVKEAKEPGEQARALRRRHDGRRTVGELASGAHR